MFSWTRSRGHLTDESLVAGASGGSLAVAAIVTNTAGQVALEMQKDCAKQCRERGTIGQIEPILRAELTKLVTDESALVASRRAAIAVTRVSPRPFKSPVMITSFAGKEDLIESCIASCHIPFYLSNKIAENWESPGSSLPRGSYMDGGFGAVIPPLEGYVGVLTFLPHWIPPHLLKGIDRDTLLSPALTPKFPYSFPSALHMAFFPGTDQDIDEVYRWGLEAGHAWSDRFEERRK